MTLKGGQVVFEGGQVVFADAEQGLLLMGWSLVNFAIRQPRHNQKCLNAHLHPRGRDTLAFV